MNAQSTTGSRIQSSGANSEIQNLSQESFKQINDSLVVIRERLIHLTNALKENSINDQITKEVLSAKQDTILDFAGKIIDLSALFFGIFVAILAIAGWIATKRFSQIDQIRKDLEKILNEGKAKIESELKELNSLKESFIDERENMLQILIPLVEGEWHYTKGQYREAIADYQKAYNIKPDHPRIYRRLNKLLTDYGRFDEAISNLEILHSKKPDDDNIVYRLGQAYRRNNQFELAEKYLNKAIAMRADYVWPRIELGLIALFNGDYETAENFFKIAYRNHIRIRGEQSHKILIYLATSQLCLKKHEECLNNFKNAFELVSSKLNERERAVFFADRALILLALGNDRYQEALDSVKQAVALGLQFGDAESIQKLAELVLGQNQKQDSSEIRFLIVEEFQKIRFD
ncbi:tetratricopeptide repeat protein [bacterium]|nr:tetratricopeptide repeat protein [bacterium]